MFKCESINNICSGFRLEIISRLCVENIMQMLFFCDISLQNCISFFVMMDEGLFQSHL